MSAINELDNFEENIFSLLESIEDCLAKGRILPCLTLLYAGLDVLGSLEKVKGEGTRASFVRWVEKYMIPQKPLVCTPLELYAARCGVLHTFTANSDLSRRGAVRKIIYAWGSAEAESLEAASALMNRSGEVAIHVRDLADSFRLGISSYLDDLGRSTERNAVFKQNAGEWLMHLEKDTVDQFIKMFGPEIL